MSYTSLPLHRIPNQEDRPSIMSPLDEISFNDDEYLADNLGFRPVQRKRRNIVKYLISTVSGLILITLIVLLATLPHNKQNSNGQTQHNQKPTAWSGSQEQLAKNYPHRVSFLDAIYGTYNFKLKTYNWIPQSSQYEDGSFLSIDAQNNICVGLISSLDKACRVLILSTDLKDPKFGTELSRRIDPDSLSLSATGKFLSFSSDSVSRWRRSSYSRWWVYSLDDKKLHEVLAPTRDESNKNKENNIMLAEWSQWSNYLAFVFINDVYAVDVTCLFINGGDCFWQITTDGVLNNNAQDGETVIFNGIADWVYEEEVLPSPKALWWSPKYPNSTQMMLSYLSFDDTQVRSNNLQKFIYSPPHMPTMTHDNTPLQYTWDERIKYPKPGRQNKNPSITLSVFEFDAESQSVGTTTKLNLAAEQTKINDTEVIVYNVQWGSLGASSSATPQLYIRITDRMQNQEEWILYNSFVSQDNVQTVTGKAIGSAISTTGWFEATPDLWFLPDTDLLIKQTLQKNEVDKSSYMHFALFDRSRLNQPIMQLTSGAWEVTSAVLGYKKNSTSNRDDIWFMGTNSQNGNATERYLYSVDLRGVNQNSSGVLDTKVLKRWGNASMNGWYSASLSPAANWIVLDKKGPGLPKQSLVSSAAQFEERLVEQTKIDQTQSQGLSQVSNSDLPQSQIVNISLKMDSGQDYFVNARVYFPMGLNATQKLSQNRYPLLVTGYWGPNSQKVDSQWSVNFNSYLSSWWHEGSIPPVLNTMLQEDGVGQTVEKQNFLFQHAQALIRSNSQPPFAVMVVDVRGSGGRGSNFREGITKDLGHLEAIDIIASTKQFISENKWIDTDKVAIWGWSYGGYQTAKVVEMDNDSVFKAAVSVAPVTDWKFYDSVYTERYMKDLQLNYDGYGRSKVNVNDNFHIVRMLVIHGSADDNVHFQNTIALGSAMQSHESPVKPKNIVSKELPELINPNAYRVHIVPDDNHSMALTPKAYLQVMRFVKDWIVDAFKEVDAVRSGLQA